MLGGAPFRFVGVNAFFLANDPAVYQCGSTHVQDPEREVDDWFGHISGDFGGKVVRFWAFQTWTDGGTDWQSFDRIMRLANTHGLKVLPVLENEWAACTRGGDKDDTWFAGGYRSPYGGYRLSYKEYVQRVVERYRDEPAIFGWMLMNEPRSATKSGTTEARGAVRLRPRHEQLRQGS